MLVNQTEIDAFKEIAHDIKIGLVPQSISPVVLLAFFTENPHLLMDSHFDEHIQEPINDPNSEELLNNSFAGDIDLRDLGLSRLDFRSPSGRWSSLLTFPNPGEKGIEVNSAYIVFWPGFRRYLRKLAELGDDPTEDQIDQAYDGLAESVGHSFTIKLDELVSDLESRALLPKNENSVLWTPKLWVPREQARQKALLDQSLAPYFKKWKRSGISLVDLNPSEFEDLVGEVLFSAGLKVYKVRQSPQGGRDLIARGTLIPGEEPIEMAVEVKHRNVVDRPDVQMALYQNKAYPALLFVTSGRFSAGVFKEKAREENRFRLFLKDGLAVGDLVRTHFRLDDQKRARAGLRS